MKPYLFEPVKSQAREACHDATESTEELDRLTNINWCWCGPNKCQVMPSAKECLCCWEVKHCDLLRGDSACITLHENFEFVALNKDVLEMSIAQTRTRLGLTPGDNTRNNSHLRNQAYKNFAHWILRNEVKKFKRIVLPACVVIAIRNHFPSSDGKYTGYQDSTNFSLA